MKKLFSFIICSALVCNFFSCKNEEEDIWEKSSAERLEDAKVEYVDFLSNSSNGWVMEYFPTPTSKGYIYLMNFHKDGSVKIGGKNEYINNTYQDSLSLWEVIGDNGPVLTLNSYNPVFHIFASPNPGFSLREGTGLEGDYEFIILQPESKDEIMLKGKKRGTYIHLKQLEEGQDWRQYFNKIDNISSTLFNKVPNAMYLVISPEEKYTLYDGSKGVFSSVPEGGDRITDAVSWPFVVTTSGLKLYEPLGEGDSKVQYFNLKADLTGLTAVEDAGAYIVSEPVVAFFLRAQTEDSKKWKFSSADMCPKMKNIYQRMEKSCVDLGLTLNQFYFTYSEVRKSFVSYMQANKGNRKTPFNYDFDIMDKGDNVVSIAFKDQYDTNGEVFYSKDGFADMIMLLSSSFKIESNCESTLNLSKIKLTDTVNPDIWFILEL